MNGLYLAQPAEVGCVSLNLAIVTRSPETDEAPAHFEERRFSAFVLFRKSRRIWVCSGR